ncbi:MAG: hypothetical protein ACXWZL_05840, partial [Mycobacterium sp.]
IAENTGIALQAYTIGADDADLADIRFAWLRKREISRRGAVMIRPDRVVGFRSRDAVDDPQAVLSDALRTILSTADLAATK